MRWAGLVVVSLLIAGCSAEPKGPSETETQTSTSATSTTGLPPTNAGVPLVAVDSAADLVVTLASDGVVHRLRLVAFKDFTLDGLTVAGGGGGGGGGGGQARQVGVALFPAEDSPLDQPSCSDAATFPAWDGRARSGDPDFAGKAGIYDLWAWSGQPTSFTLEVNGGGDALNATAQSHNWTSSLVTPTVTKSGPAQTTADFDEAIPVATGALVLARYTPPNGYPQETMSLAVQLDGTECGPGVASGGGNGFGSQILDASAFVGPGQANVAGRYTAALSPIGEGTASIVILQPK